MNTVDKIFQLINEKGLTAKEFANKVGVSQGNITDWKTGRANPSIESLQKIARYAGVQLEWLTGNSKFRTHEEALNDYLKNQDSIIIIKTINKHMDKLIDLNFDANDINELIDALTPNDVNEASEIYALNIQQYLNKFDSTKRGKIFDIILKVLDELVKNERRLTNYHTLMSLAENEKKERNDTDFTSYPTQNFYNCPVYGRISAGQPNWAEECLEGYLPIDPSLMGIIAPEEHFFLRVNGESMNKVIRNGAYALIHKQDIVENGEIAVVLVNGDEATLKKFSKQGDLVILEPMSDDTSFQVQVYNNSTPINILGKYVGKFEINK